MSSFSFQASADIGSVRVNTPAVEKFTSSLLRANLAGHPNEDFVLADETSGVFIVLDGVTRTNFPDKYPDPSPAAQASEKFAVAAHSRLLELLPDNAGAETSRNALEMAVRSGNRAVERLNQDLFGGDINYLDRDFAGTVGIVGVLRGENLYFAYLGDVRGYALRASGSVDLFTEIQTSKVSALRQGPDGWADSTTLKIRSEIRNNKNHDMGFGVFTGESQALDFVKFGVLPLKSLEAVLFATDGIVKLAEANILALRRSSLESIADSAEQIVKESDKSADDIGMIRIEAVQYLAGLLGSK
jgi:serine/threonine protein phosphatase PrpC